MKLHQQRSPLATVAKGAAVVAASVGLVFAGITPAVADDYHWIYVAGG